MMFDFIKNLINSNEDDEPPSDNLKWSKEELEEFKERLLEEKLITRIEIESLEERIKDIEAYSSDEKSDNLGSEMNSFNTERSSSIKELQRVRNYLESLENSLKRIEDGTYGICQKCQCKINKERLIAVPTTTLSASWKLQGKCPENGIDTLIMRKIGNGKV
jgi:DnaK suppressor protein